MKPVGGDSFPLNLYFFHKNWQQCKLATVLIFKISLIDPPIDAFDGDISNFSDIWIFKKFLPVGGGGITLIVYWMADFELFITTIANLPQSFFFQFPLFVLSLLFTALKYNSIFPALNAWYKNVSLWGPTRAFDEVSEPLANYWV